MPLGAEDASLPRKEEAMLLHEDHISPLGSLREVVLEWLVTSFTFRLLFKDLARPRLWFGESPRLANKDVALEEAAEVVVAATAGSF